VFVPFIEPNQPMRMLKIDSLDDLEETRVLKNIFIRQPKNPQSRPEGKRVKPYNFKKCDFLIFIHIQHWMKDWI
jgi:hypothetical protein